MLPTYLDTLPLLNQLADLHEQGLPWPRLTSWAKRCLLERRGARSLAGSAPDADQDRVLYEDLCPALDQLASVGLHWNELARLVRMRQEGISLAPDEAPVDDLVDALAMGLQWSTLASWTARRRRDREGQPQ